MFLVSRHIYNHLGLFQVKTTVTGNVQLGGRDLDAHCSVFLGGMEVTSYCEGG